MTAYEFKNFTVSTVHKRKSIDISYYVDGKSGRQSVSISGIPPEEVFAALGIEIPFETGNFNPPAREQKVVAEKAKEEIKAEVVEVKEKKTRKRKTKKKEPEQKLEPKVIDVELIEPEENETASDPNEVIIEKLAAANNMAKVIAVFKEEEALTTPEEVYDRIEELKAHVPKLGKIPNLKQRVERAFSK